MHRRPAATFLRPFGLLAAILLATFAGIGPSALANDTPGNNGTVKLHEGSSENDPGEVRNEPHVCTFHLHFYFADPEQAGTWEIQEWAPTGQKGAIALSGTYDTAGDGEDRDPEVGVHTLPDGHYKLFWDGDLDTDKHDKMKVFWVDCAAAESSPSPSGNELPIASGSVAPSISAAPSNAPSASPSGNELPIASGSTGPSASSTTSTAPGGSEAPVEGENPASSTAPLGSELPLTGEAPVGGVLGVSATPPPTDTGVAPAGGSDGWRVVLMGLAGLIGAAIFLVPLRTAKARARIRDRGRR